MQLALQPSTSVCHPGPLVLGQLLSLLHPWQIGTELSHDVLNQLTYHFNWRTAKPLGPAQPQDVMSRHRGAKHPRRYGLLRVSACYPRRTFYPLSDGPSSRTTGSYDRLRLCSTCQSRSQQLLPLHSTNDF